MLRPVRSRSRTNELPISRFNRGMPPKPGISPKAQFREAEASHLVRNNQVANQGQLKSAAKANAMNRGNCRRGDEVSMRLNIA